MTPFSLQLNLSPHRYRTFTSNSASIRYHRAVRSSGLVSHASLSPKTSPSSKHKARSSASVSVLTSLISVFKLKSQGKKCAHKVSSPVRSVMAESDECHDKEGLQRARSFSSAGKREKNIRCKCIASSADGMEVNVEEEDAGEEVCITQYLYYDVSENPFATPPCTPGKPLSPMMLDDDAEAPTSSPDSVQSRRKRRAVEQSWMKTLQLLGPEASMAISEQYGYEISDVENLK